MKFSFVPLLVFVVGSALSAQEIRVHVLPAVNRTGQAQFEAVATTVTDTVTLTLQLFGSYRISEGTPTGFSGVVPLPENPDDRDEILAEMAQTIPAENIVFGEVVVSGHGDSADRSPGTDRNGGNAAAVPSQSGVPQLILSVYDRLEGEVVLTERRQPGSLFDIFRATDEIAAALLTSFSGRRVAFGSIRLAPRIQGAEEAQRAETPEYTVILDGQRLGTNLRSVDSILTGAHTLTVTTEIEGEQRTIYDQEITIQEDGITEVSLPLPNVAVLEPEAPEDAAQAAVLTTRAAEQRLAEALAALAEERRDGQFAVAEEYFLAADSFIDPVAIREAARENAARAAESEIARGQLLLREREWERGVASHQLVAELGRTFESDDLFGYQAEVGLVARNWMEYSVQQERKPTIWPVFPLVGLAVWTFLDVVNGDDFYYEPSGPRQSELFTHAGLVGASLLWMWNSSDWDMRPRRRALTRYGESASIDSESVWNPQRWELDVGGIAGMNIAAMAVPSPTGDALEETPLLLSGHNMVNPLVSLRRWFDAHHAVQVTLVPGLLTGGFVAYEDGYGRREPYVDVNDLFFVRGSYRYSRSGRSHIELGIQMRLFRLERAAFDPDDIDASDGGIALTNEEIVTAAFFGDEDQVTIWSPGVRFGVGWRFGRSPTRPWEVGLDYSLQYFDFNAGSVDPHTFYVPGLSLTMGRSFGFGGSATSGVAIPTPVGDRRLQQLREQTEERWAPAPVSIRFDPGGFLTAGAAVSLEWNPLPQLGVLVQGRHYGPRSPVPNIASTHLYPGIGLRYYFRSASSLGPPSGAYVGTVIERIAYEWWGTASQVATRTELTISDYSGVVWIPQLDVGYRLPVWRSSFVDLGVTVGYPIGELDKDPGTIDVPRLLPWYNLVFAIGAPLY